MARKDVVQLEDRLAAVSAALPYPGEPDKFHFHDEMYPGLLRDYDRAKADVARLGLTEIVEDAIRDSIRLLDQGRRLEAQDLLIEACGKLRERSGTWDAMRRMYTAANDPDGAADQRSL